MQCLFENGLRRHARIPQGREAAGLNREKALAALNGKLLREFSRRTTGRLRAALPLRLALPALEPFLAENVAKEVRKDARLIHCAAAALAAGAAPAPEVARQLLAAAREADRDFLARVARFPVRIEIPYHRIEPLRLRRIELGLDLAYRILETWQRGRKTRSVLSREELARRLHELLDLYVQETQALSDAVHLPAVLAPVRDRIALRLREEMSDVARAMSRKE